MEYAVEANLDTREPSRYKAAYAYGDAAAKNPPKASTDSERAGRWRAAGIGVDGSEADARTQQAEQKLKNDGQDDAAPDGCP
jgi:hypothetical protein